MHELIPVDMYEKALGFWLYKLVNTNRWYVCSVVINAMLDLTEGLGGYVDPSCLANHKTSLKEIRGNKNMFKEELQ